MNKSKFLKRSLATLLAILLVVAMVPMSALAEDDDVGQDLNITVDTYRATRNSDGDYEVTVYDSNDVTIAWAPIPGTTLKLVTKDKVELDLPYKLYLAENAVVSGDTYTVTLKETVGTADPVEYKLKITVSATVADDDATLAAVRVDNVSGDYGFGYLTGTAIPGYISDVGTSGIKAHAISGEIDEANETITITLPFGMDPTNVGLGTQFSTAAPAEKIFAPHSIHAQSKYVYNGNGTGEVTVTAKTNVVNQYKVVFKNEQVFESFAGAANLEDLEKVVENSGLAKMTVNLPVDNLNAVKDTTWVPEFTTAAGVKRIMGNSGSAEGTKPTTVVLDFGKTAGSPFGEWMKVDSETINQPDMLKLITSKHASWTTVAGTDNYVYLLVRTKANPSGAWVEVNLHANGAPKTSGVYIKEVQVDNVQSVTNIDKDATTINVTVDREHSTMWGNTSAGNQDSTDCYMRITTSGAATIEVPHQEDNVTITSNGDNTRHLIDGINAKSGSFMLWVVSEDETKHEYTIRLTPATSSDAEIESIQLYDGDTLVKTTIKSADAANTFEIEVPYKYQPGAGKDGENVVLEQALQDLKFYVNTSKGAMVVPGADGISNVQKAAGRDNKTPITSGVVGPVDDPTVIENSVTKVSDVWKKIYTSSTGSTGVGEFGKTLYLTVTNVDNTGSAATPKVFQVKLKRGKPDTTAAITNVTANKALDSDYIYSVATTLGTQLTGQTDIGQAYVGAVDAKGNELKVDVESNAIKVHVPTNWTDDDTLYLTEVKFNGQGVSRVGKSTANVSGYALVPYTLSSIQQEDQTLTTGTDGNGNSADIIYRGFNKLSTNSSAADELNTLYVYSEAKYYEDGGSTTFGAKLSTAIIEWLKTNAKAYKIYIVKDVVTNTGRTLTNVSSDKATVEFRSNYDAIKVTVPGSMNWTTGYREDNSKDFHLKFDTSEGAIVVDLGQRKENTKIARDSLNSTTAGKYDNTRNGTTAAFPTTGSGATIWSDSAAEYLRQLNEHYQITDDTIFFVMGGELYIYDELTGDQIRVTGEGGSFTNTNWGQIKTKQAEIGVWNEAQRASINYRLDLAVGAKSNQNSILSLSVGETAAAINGTSITATLPADSDKEQALTITASAAATVSVNGEPYQSDLPIDLTKPATIVVTAEDGTEATYTLTVTFSDDTPDPDKPSSKFEDLDKVTNDTMRDFVKRAIDMGIMGSTSTTKFVFAPMATVSRKDFAVIIARADLMANNEDITNTAEADARLQELYGGEDAFDDIASLNPTQKAGIKYCAEKGYISGDGKGGFDPNGSIERQAAAIILAKWRGLEVDESNTENENNVADWNTVANWAKPYVNAVMTDGLMSGTGNGNFTPAGVKGTVNREQTAVMLVRVFDKKYPSFS